MKKPTNLFGRMVAELFGTFLIVFLGCGAVHAAVLMDAQSGIWQIAVVWGVAIALAIFSVDAISGAHLNPAMTISLSIWGRHDKSLVVPYIGAQVAGAFLAAWTLFLLFSGFLLAKEEAKGVVRGEPGSIVTAMCYGEYSPSPGPVAAADGAFDPTQYNDLKKRFPTAAAWIAEALGTGLLAIVVFALTDKRNSARPQSNLTPVFIGSTVAALISVIAPLTQACFNPARDFGPRLFAYFAGWGPVALPGLQDLSWLTIYILSPITGAVLGGGFYQCVIAPHQPHLHASKMSADEPNLL